MFAVVMLTACNTEFGLVYDVSITGDGDGNVEVTFPQGSFAMNGKADINLALGDSIPFNKVTTKAEVIQKKNKKEIAVLEAVNNAMCENFDAHSEDGTYDILIEGIVTETGTGLSFSVNKRLTNRDIATKTIEAEYDEYEYIK